MQTMTIGKAAREAGVNIETIRFYERRGLIERPPKGNGYRVYSPGEVARIRFIKEAQQIGFSLSEIGCGPTRRRTVRRCGAKPSQNSTKSTRRSSSFERWASPLRP